MKARGHHRVKVNGRGGPGALQWEGRQRGPGRLGNQAMPGLLGRAIVCDSYLEIQVSKENFVSIRWVIRGFEDGLPEEEFTPRLIDTCWAKGASIMARQDEETRDWLGS